MNRNRLIIIGCAALVLAALVSLSVYRVLNAAIASAHSADTTAVVAAFDLPVGSVISERDVRVMRFQGASLPSGYFTRVQDVVGRGVITPIVRNELVLNNKVAAENAGGGLPAMIPPGMRAVAVKVNDVIGVAGFALPGTRVDVVVTGTSSRSNDPGDVTATTVLQNVQVLAAGQKLQKNDGKPEDVQVITLLVTPEEAQKLALATQEGKIQLTLRNPLDADASSVKVVKNAALYGGAPAPVHTVKKSNVIAEVKTVPPPATYSVEMIRGDKKIVTTFPAEQGEPK